MAVRAQAQELAKLVMPTRHRDVPITVSATKASIGQDHPLAAQQQRAGRFDVTSTDVIAGPQQRENPGERRG